jgi:hypothetical protein
MTAIVLVELAAALARFLGTKQPPQYLRDPAQRWLDERATRRGTA